jgi:hypothetical protein
MADATRDLAATAARHRTLFRRAFLIAQSELVGLDKFDATDDAALSQLDNILVDLAKRAVAPAAETDTGERTGSENAGDSARFADQTEGDKPSDPDQSPAAKEIADRIANVVNPSRSPLSQAPGYHAP